MDTLQARHYLPLALEAAQAAGAVHLKYFRKRFSVQKKSAHFDLVTQADKEAERAAVRIIRRSCAQHNILAEENRYPRTASAFTWIIDPLDGTNNFSCGIPIFCSSVALAYEGDVILGALYDSVHRELFWACRGGGAFLNGKPIRVNAKRSLRAALLITGFYYKRGPQVDEALAAMGRFYRKGILGIRRFGAAALDLCAVSCGRSSGYWEYLLSPWDFAAGMLLVREAGGLVTGKKGEDISALSPAFVVASNKYIHRQMLAVIDNTADAHKGF